MNYNLHKFFTNTLIDKLNVDPFYSIWSSAPDLDLFDWHRYKYHRLSSFDKLYNMFVESHDVKHAINLDITKAICLGHIYLDTLNGPVKAFDGINLSVNHKVLEILDTGYSKTINTVYQTITNLSPAQESDIAQSFEIIRPHDISTISYVFLCRLFEESIGLLSPMSNPILPVPVCMDSPELNDAYQSIIDMELTVIETLQDI